VAYWDYYALFAILLLHSNSQSKKVGAYLMDKPQKREEAKDCLLPMQDNLCGLMCGHDSRDNHFGCQEQGRSCSQRAGWKQIINWRNT